MPKTAGSAIDPALITPLDDKVLLKRHQAQDRKGAVYLPQTAQSRPQKATVISAGPGRRLDKGGRDPMPVKPGDVVLVSKWGGTILELGAGDKRNDDYMVVKQDEILAVVQEPDQDD